MEEIFKKMDEMNCKCMIYRSSRFSWQKEDSKEWSADIEGTHDGTTVKVEEKGQSAKEALEVAWFKFQRVCEKGMPLARLAAPIEAKPDEV